MSKCGNNFQIVMCKVMNFLSEFIKRFENNPVIKKFTDLVGSMSSRPDKLDTVDIEKISEKEKFLDKLCDSNIFSDNMFEKL